MLRRNLRKLKKLANRKYRHRAKQDLYLGNDINEKPCLTPHDII